MISHACSFRPSEQKMMKGDPFLHSNVLSLQPVFLIFQNYSAWQVRALPTWQGRIHIPFVIVLFLKGSTLFSHHLHQQLHYIQLQSHWYKFRASLDVILVLEKDTYLHKPTWPVQLEPSSEMSVAHKQWHFLWREPSILFLLHHYSNKHRRWSCDYYPSYAQIIHLAWYRQHRPVSAVWDFRQDHP